MEKEERPGDVLMRFIHVTPEGLGLLREWIKDPVALGAFVRSPDAIDRLKAVSNSGSEGLELVGQVLSAPDAVSALVKNRKAAATLDLIRAQPLTRRAEILAVPYVVFTLANNGKGADAIALIREQPLPRQAAILAAPNAILGLADTGNAREALDLIRMQPQPQQARILAAPYAVSTLAHNGMATQTWWLIQEQPTTDQAIILAAPHAVLGLAHNGRMGEIRALRESLLPGVTALRSKFSPVA